MVKLLVVVDVKDMVVVLVNVVGRKVVNSSAGSALLLSDTKGSRKKDQTGVSSIYSHLLHHVSDVLLTPSGE